MTVGQSHNSIVINIRLEPQLKNFLSPLEGEGWGEGSKTLSAYAHLHRLPTLQRLHRRLRQRQGIAPILDAGRGLRLAEHAIDEMLQLCPIGRIVALQEEVQWLLADDAR